VPSRRASSFPATVAVTLASRWAMLVCLLASGVVVARALGPGDKGAFVLTYLLLNQTVSVGNFGVPQALVYHTASGRLSRSDAVGHLILCSLACAAVATVPYWVVVRVAGAQLFPGVAARTLMLIALLLAPSLLLANAGGLLRGLGRLDLFNALSLFDAVIRLAAVVVALPLLHLGLPGAVQATALATVVTGVASVVLAVVAARVAPTWNLRALGPVIGYGFKSYLTVVLQMTERKIDVFMLGALLAPEAVAWQVGLYSVAVSMAELPRQVSGAVSTVLLPKISKASTADGAAALATVPRVSRNLLAVNVAFGVVLAVAARPALGLLYGHAFLSAFVPFLILLPGVVAASVWNVLQAEMVGTGHPARLSAFAGLTLVLNVAINLVTIPRWGIAGAALTSGITYSLLSVLLLLDYRARNRTVRMRELIVPRRADLAVYLRMLGREALPGRAP